MTEERIKSAAETIHSANKLSITKGVLSIIAAEARNEGIEEESRIRKFIWLNHGCPIHVLYGDDGEMQCSNMTTHRPLDFKRMKISELLDALEEDWAERGKKELAKRLKEQGCDIERNQ